MAEMTRMTDHTNQDEITRVKNAGPEDSGKKNAGPPERPADMDKWAYYDSHKSEIITDIEELGAVAMQKKWRIWDLDWRRLRKCWGIETKVIKGRKTQSIPAIPGARDSAPEQPVFRAHDHKKSDPLARLMAEVEDIKTAVANLEVIWSSFPPFSKDMPESVQVKWLETFKELSLAAAEREEKQMKR